MKKNRFNLQVLLLGLLLLVCFGCIFEQQPKKETGAVLPDTETVAKFQQEQKDLLAKANTELADLNKKIISLNDKLHGKGVKLTEAQNKELDDVEEHRAAINQRVHQIKNVTMNDWAAFKAQFETDLTEVNAHLDKILAEL